MRREDA